MRILSIIFLLLFANIGFAQNNNVSNTIISSSILNTTLANNAIELAYNFCDSNVLQIQIETSVRILDLNKNYSIQYIIARKNKAATVFLDTTIAINFEQLISQKNIYNTKSNSININTLNTGNYTVRTFLLKNKFAIDSSTILMQRWNARYVVPDVVNKIADTNYLNQLQQDGVINIKNTFVAKYPASTIINYLKALTPIASSTEDKVLGKLLAQKNDTLNRLFFYNFWQNRNKKNPKAEWETYAQKLNYVASNFGTAGIAGYATDRGRIYLRYGEPHKFETVSNEQGALPYEVWQYDAIVNGKEITFLFVQSGNMGSQLSLLHSTMPGELFNPYWMSTLIRDNTKTDYRIFNYLQAPSELNNR